MTTPGPYGDIVLTSRVRLARNLSGHRFPGWSEESGRKAVLEEVGPVVQALPEMSEGFFAELNELEARDKHFLVERHLISRELAARSSGCAAAVNRRQSLSVMVNEEDHLRLQSIQPGLNLRAAHAAADAVDTALEATLPWAFDPSLGYLTACPSNLGTGMRASAMLHLPALVLSGEIGRVVHAANKIGLAVRGFYGEGTESLGNLYQVSNQSTLGDPEEAILARIHKVIERIIENEKNARLKLLDENPSTVRDQVGRAYAILRHGYIIPSKEALNLVSMLRLGMDLGLLPPDEHGLIDTLLMDIQPAHLQFAAKSKLGAEERDILRAEILRRRLHSLPAPGTFPENAPEADDTP